MDFSLFSPVKGLLIDSLSSVTSVVDSTEVSAVTINENNPLGVPSLVKLNCWSNEPLSPLVYTPKSLIGLLLNNPSIAAIEAERKRDIEENATGLSSARKGDKGIFWTQFKGSRQDSEVDQEVTVKSVSKYGVLFDTDSAKWKNFNDSWNYFKNLTREAEINAKYAAKVKALTNTPTNKTKRVLTSGTPLRIRKSFDEIFAEDRIDAPIKVQVERDGQLVTVGYLPRLAWLNSRDNTASENYENLSDTEAYPADVEVDRVRKIRELITTGNLDTQYTFKVKDKGLGKLAITTDRDADGKKVNKPVSEIMPRYITSKYFAGTVQPFTIFNKDFLINPDTSFGGMIAVTEETMEFLKEKGSGSVFMMIPTAVPGVFIPTPASTPYLSDNISTLLVDTIVASVTGSNPELLRKIADNYGISIDSRTKLKDFLSEYVYFTSVDKINVTSGDGRVRIAFDTKTSTILINNGDGRVADKITLNTAKSNPEQFNTKIAKFKQSLLNTKLSVRLSKINSIDNFSVPLVAENGDINFEDSTYNKFLADNIKTDLVEIVTKNDIPVYVIQPVITMQQSGETAEKPVETIEVGEEVIDVPEGFGEGFDNVGLEDTPISDELIGVEQAEAIKGLSSSFLVKDGDYVYTSERQRTIVQTISAGVYSQFLDSDKEGKKLPVNLAFANANVRAFEALVSITLIATAEAYEVRTLRGVQKNGSWDMSETSNGDDSGVVFSITNAGQVQYTSANSAGFSSNTMKFRAITTAV